MDGAFPVCLLDLNLCGCRLDAQGVVVGSIYHHTGARWAVVNRIRRMVERLLVEVGWGVCEVYRKGE